MNIALTLDSEVIELEPIATVRGGIFTKQVKAHPTDDNKGVVLEMHVTRAGVPIRINLEMSVDEMLYFITQTEAPNYTKN